MVFNNSINLKSQGTAYYSSSGVFSGIDGSTAGKILTSNGTGVAPSFQSAPTNNLVLLSSQPVTTVSNINFTSLISATYNTYLLVYNSTITASAALELLLSVNNGSTYINTGYQGGQNRNAYITATISNANTTSLAPLAGSTGQYWLTNLQNGSNFIGFGTGAAFLGSNISYYEVCAQLATASINAIQVTVTSGTITGTFSLYGVLE